MLRLYEITKDNRKLCNIVKQEPFRIKSLLLLLTRRLLMPRSSLLLPAPAKVKQVKSITKLLSALHWANFDYWFINFQNFVAKKTTKVNYEVCISLIILKANMKKHQTLTLVLLLCFVLIFIEERCHCPLLLFKRYEGIKTSKINYTFMLRCIQIDTVKKRAEWNLHLSVR